MKAFSFDWKFVVALGACAVCIILASKLSSDSAERVSIRAIDAARDCAITLKGGR